MTQRLFFARERGGFPRTGAERKTEDGKSEDGIMTAAKERFKNNTELILYFLRGCAGYFAVAVVFAALVSLFDMITPKIITFTVDSVIGNDPAELPGFAKRLVEAAGGIPALRSRPAVIALCVAPCGLMAALSRVVFRSFNSRGAEKFVCQARDDLFSHILHLPYTWLSENNTGDIIQRCTSDVQTIKRFVSEQLISLVRTTILIVMALTFMGSTDWRVMLLSAAYIPVIIGYSVFFHSRIGSAFRTADEEEGVLSTIAQENLTGVRVVRAFGREIYERERFEKQNSKYTDLWIHLIKLLSIFWSSMDVVTGLQVLTVLTAGSVFCVRGTLTAGKFIALVAYTLMLMWPVRVVGRIITEMSKAGISIDRLRYIMNAEPEADPPDPVSPPMDRDITFDHVTFTYENGSAEVLRDVSFTIPAGTTVGILGGTGSGKSTLMYLLERLYTLPEECGTISVGGVDIRKMSMAHLRSNIGMVLQEPYLFSRTLEENIGIREKKYDREKIRSAAKVARIDDTISSFTSGYETFVGERGVTLSGGQKQRTAIAQMLVGRPPVMIFDDSLSAVDAETDRRIRSALRENTAGSTVILIAHRITTLMHADNIIVLEDGRVRESGNHEELLARNGLYRKIFDLQTGGLYEEEDGSYASLTV